MDWMAHLNFEVERRDRRHTYLWAILVSSATGTAYVMSFALWNLTGPRTPNIAALGLGAVFFLLLMSKFAARLWEEMHLEIAPDEFSIAKAILMIRHYRNNGFWKTLVADVPTLAAYALIVTALSIHALHASRMASLIGWSLVIAISATFLAELSPYLIPRKYIVGVLSTVVIGIISDAPNWKELKEHAGPLVAELRKMAAWPGRKPTLGHARGVAKSFVKTGLSRRTIYTYIILVASASYLSIPLAQTLVQMPLYDPMVIARLVSLALLVALTLFTSQVFLLIQLDNTRRHLDQLRYSIFSSRCSKEFAPTVFESINFLQSARMYPSGSLSSLVESLDLSGIHSMKTRFHQATLSTDEAVER